jgi:hypothetical protein
MEMLREIVDTFEECARTYGMMALTMEDVAMRATPLSGPESGV